MDFTGGSTVSLRAIALKSLLTVTPCVAASSLVAWLVGTGQELILAHASIPALRTDALVTPRGCLVHTGAVILAGIHIAITGANLRLTLVPTVARCTLANVQLIPLVAACGTIETRTMIDAVIQILIAEDSSPPLGTVTTPGLVTCTVHTARMQLTFIAQWSSPTRLTTAIKLKIVKN